MKRFNMVLATLTLCLAIIAVGCKKDKKSSSGTTTDPNTPTVSVGKVSMDYCESEKIVTIKLGAYTYYGAEVDADGDGWCEVEKMGLKAKGQVKITTKTNIEFVSRSCHVICWVSNVESPSEDDKVKLTVVVNQAAAVANGTYQGHDFVNLGLPSGTLWATCNIGADTPEEWGNRYAWGETTIKGTDKYTWEYYKHCKGSRETLTKYNQGEQVGYQGYTDNLTELEPMDDAATVNWGSGWCMPTLTQIRELSTYTYWSWETTPNGVKGNRYTSKTNGNSIFIPADADGHYATIWTKSLYAGINAWKLTQGGDTYGIDWAWRCDGIRVRPVRKK